MSSKWILIPLMSTFVSFSSIAAEPPKNRISMQEAQEIVTKAQKGTIESKNLEHEHGEWIYSFDIRANDKMIHEIQVDAKSGKIVSQTIETPKQEKQETTGEKQGQ